MLKLQTNFKFMTMSTLMVSAMSLTACQTMSDTMDNFRSEAKPEARYVPELIAGETQTLLISPKRVSCNSELPMQCLIVSTEGGMSRSIFQLPYDGIEGFSARPNMTYKISARPLIDQNNNQATGRWQLQSILSQRAVRPQMVN